MFVLSNSPNLKVINNELKEALIDQSFQLCLYKVSGNLIYRNVFNKVTKGSEKVINTALMWEQSKY